jgi:hypothetical protein
LTACKIAIAVAAAVGARRETARVTREPVNERLSGAELADQEVAVLLREEEAVVEKQTVAKERIGLEKDVDVEQETVRDEVRKERVDVAATNRCFSRALDTRREQRDDEHPPSAVLDTLTSGLQWRGGGTSWVCLRSSLS